MEIPTRLFNTALMVAPQAVDEILAAKAAGVLPEKAPACLSDDTLKAFVFLGNETVFMDEGYAIVDGVALIEILGGLSYRPYGWWDEASYSDIRNMFRAAIAEERASSVLFLIDSPGGEVAGLFDLVDEIYNARGTKPIIAVVDEAAFSAAYAIASAADEVYLPSTAQVGSIGVIAIHRDQSGFDEDLGFRYTPIFAGDHKNDFNPHEPLKADGKDILQAHVDKLYDMFTAVVARNRGMTQADVVATQAAIYMGKAAVGAGLADGVRPVRDIMSRMSLSKGDTVMNLNEVRDVINQALAESMLEVKAMMEDIEARLPALELEPPDVPDHISNDLPADIVDVCEIAGMPELAGVMIRDGLTLDEAKSVILDAKAKAAEKASIVSTVGPLSTGEVNPLLADAKKRAQKLVTSDK